MGDYALGGGMIRICWKNIEYNFGVWLILPGPSIEHDLEGLWWSSNGDGTIVSNVLVVGERLRLEASFLMEPSSRLTVECS